MNWVPKGVTKDILPTNAATSPPSRLIHRQSKTMTQTQLDARPKNTEVRLQTTIANSPLCKHANQSPERKKGVTKRHQVHIDTRTWIIFA